MNFPEDLKYSETHEWVRLENGLARVGVTDFAQQELTDIVFVELPEVGRVVAAQEACCVIESTKVAADVYAPISGEVKAVNLDLSNHPEWINESPYEKGWLYILAPSDPTELEALEDAAQYRESIQDE